MHRRCRLCSSIHLRGTRSRPRGWLGCSHTCLNKLGLRVGRRVGPRVSPGRRRTCAARRSGEAGNGGVCGGPPDRQQCPATSRHGHGRRATLRALSSACSRLQVPRRAAVVASRHRPEISTAPGADKLVRLHTLGEGSEGAPRTPRACQRGEQWRCDHRGVANSRRVGKSSVNPLSLTLDLPAGPGCEGGGIQGPTPEL